MKSFVAKDGSGEPPSPGRNGERDFHGEQRSNETHASTTDPEAKLSKKGKGKEAKLAYTGNVMTENRNGFVVEAELRQAFGAHSPAAYGPEGMRPRATYRKTAAARANGCDQTLEFDRSESNSSQPRLCARSLLRL
jgi:hypothetical protein